MADEQKCACGIPGPGNERECHADYYDGETFAIDSGGEYRQTNVCKCGCHRAGHTPEPWEIAPCCAEDDSLDIVSEYAPMPNGTVSANWIAVCEVTDDDEGSWARNRANAARIVACVNALEGIEDPSAALRDVVSELRWIFCESTDDGAVRRDVLGSIGLAAKRALAKLGHRS